MNLILDESRAQAVANDMKQWIISANSATPILTKANWAADPGRSYSLKNSKLSRFLQYEKQKVGINLGWTDDASAATEPKVARWFFTRSGSATGPVAYGEFLAMGYGKSPSYVRHEKRTIGIDLGWSDKPVFEWRLLGGTAGAPIDNRAWLAIHNEKAGNFLIHFDRTAGGDIGWPDSRTWGDQAWEAGKKRVLRQLGL